MQEALGPRSYPCLGIALVLAVFLFAHGQASAQLDKQDQKCVSSVNKGAAKISRAQAGDIVWCMREGSKGKLSEPDSPIEKCIRSDPKSRVSKTISKIKVGDCPGPPAFPPIDTDPGSIGQTMIRKELDLIHSIFGSDLDVVIADAAAGKEEKVRAGCQSAIANAVAKCQDTKLKVFNTCQKDGLQGTTPPGLITSTQELQDACLGTGANPMPDPKNQISGAKGMCDGKLDETIAMKCGGPEYDDLFPGCAGQALETCLDQKIECALCKTLNTLDGLHRDCDLFDDGLPNGSCDCPECTLDYRSDIRWLCKPGMAENHCLVSDLAATKIMPDTSTVLEPHTPGADPNYDCFYIYPTVHLSGPIGNHTDFSDITPELGPVRSQAARLNNSCRIFAPLYRQITLETYRSPDPSAFLDIAYSDVKAAFDHYLSQYNEGRNFVIMGHSQGTHMTSRLLQEEIDPNGSGLRGQLITALLIGGEMIVPEGQLVGGTFQNIPLCTSDAETGCVIAYRTYAEGYPPAWGSNVMGPEGMDTACTNPAALGGGEAHFKGSYFPISGMIFGMIWFPDFGTPFNKYEDFYAGECVKDDQNRSYLEIRVRPGPGDLRENLIPWDSLILNPFLLGTHILDFDFALGDMIELVEIKAAAME